MRERERRRGVETAVSVSFGFIVWEAPTSNNSRAALQGAID
jgi:hypothetical protein